MKYFCIIALSLFCWSSIEAQKIGHLNSQLLLSEMPEVRGAESNLEAFQAQLNKRFQKMIEDFQRKYQDLSTREQAGEIAPKKLEEETQKLREEEEKIQAFEADMQQKVMDRRQELLQPILDRINGIIESVSKELGYDYIIDQSSGTILFGDDKFDITDIVREKLGM
jgi:outer membrane protein